MAVLVLVRVPMLPGEQVHSLRVPRIVVSGTSARSGTSRPSTTSSAIIAPRMANVETRQEHSILELLHACIVLDHGLCS